MCVVFIVWVIFCGVKMDSLDARKACDVQDVSRGKKRSNNSISGYFFVPIEEGPTSLSEIQSECEQYCAKKGGQWVRTFDTMEGCKCFRRS